MTTKEAIDILKLYIPYDKPFLQSLGERFPYLIRVFAWLSQQGYGKCTCISPIGKSYELLDFFNENGFRIKQVGDQYDIYVLGKE